MDLPRPVAGDGAAAARGAEGGERTALGRVIDRSGREKEGGATRAARALRLWTSMVGGRACDTRRNGGGGGGKVAAEVDCNWFILINDDLLCCSSKNGNSGTVFVSLLRPPPD